MKKYFLMSFLILVVAFLTAFSSLAAQPFEKELHLKSKAELWSEEICLTDIIEEEWIRNRCNIDQQSCCLWKISDLENHTLSRVDVIKGISKLNFGAFSLKISGQDEIIVNQVKRKLTEEEIKNKIAVGSSPKIIASSIKILSPIYIDLKKENKWDVVLPSQIESKMQVKIKNIEDEEIIGLANIEAAVKSKIFIAKKTIHPHELLDEKDFELKDYNILPFKKLGIQPYFADQFPIGVRTKNTILSGKPLLDQTIEKVPLVRFGDSVTLILHSDNLRISTKGIVQGSAAVGDVVSVQLARYHRIFKGKLTQGRQVEVWF